jgi:hypothetical protein
MIERTMTHLNSNSLVSIAIETTGDNPRLHDVCFICIVLLDNYIKPSTQIVPFYTAIQPFRPENIDPETASISPTKLNNAMIHGIAPSLAADRLEEWVKLLDMPEGKRIVPIVHGWERIHSFLREWLGFHNCKHLISEEARDLRTAALYLNDCLNHRAKPMMYTKVLPSFIGQAHNIQWLVYADVMEKALKQAEIYRLMLGISNS